MESLENEDRCPNCAAAKMKSWGELKEEERMLAERQPASAHFIKAERQKHRFCTRCWYEDASRRPVQS